MNCGLPSLLHVMHMCREANLASSSSWMYIAYNLSWLIWFTPSLVLCFEQKGGEKFDDFVFTSTPLLMIDKKGEKYLRYMHVFPYLRGNSIYFYADMFCFANRRKRIWCMFISIICIHIHVPHCHIYYFVLCMS